MVYWYGIWKYAETKGAGKQAAGYAPGFWILKNHGCGYASSIFAKSPNKSPFGQNADFGAPMGAIPKVLGYESVIPSLGPGGIKGLHNWEHSTGEKLLAARGKDLYLLSGESGSISKSTQADWEAGTLDDTATTSPGDLKLLAGTFNEVDTLTADRFGHLSCTGGPSPGL